MNLLFFWQSITEQLPGTTFGVNTYGRQAAVATLSTGSGKRKAVGEKRLPPPKFLECPRPLAPWLPDVEPQFGLGFRDTPFLIVSFCRAWVVEPKQVKVSRPATSVCTPPAPLSSGLLGPSASVTTLPLSVLASSQRPQPSESFTLWDPRQETMVSPTPTPCKPSQPCPFSSLFKGERAGGGGGRIAKVSQEQPASFDRR